FAQVVIARFSTLGGFTRLAQVLVVLPSTLVSPGKGICYVDTGVLALEVFEVTRHLGRYLIKFLAPGSGVKGGLETQTVKLLIVTKTAAGLQIVFLFGAPQTN